MTQQEANKHAAKWTLIALAASGCGPDDEIQNDANGPRTPSDRAKMQKAFDRVYKTLERMASK